MKNCDLESLDLEAAHRAWKSIYATAAASGPWHPKDKERIEKSAIIAAVRAAHGLEVWAHDET